MKITEKQQLFIHEYLIDFNAGKAAARAGYSQRTASSIGSALLGNPLVKQCIDDRMKQLTEKLGLVAEDVLKNIEIIRKEAMDAQKYMIGLKALELEGRYFGMFSTKINVGGSVRVYNCEP